MVLLLSTTQWDSAELTSFKDCWNFLAVSFQSCNNIHYMGLCSFDQVWPHILLSWVASWGFCIVHSPSLNKTRFNLINVLAISSVMQLWQYVIISFEMLVLHCVRIGLIAKVFLFYLNWSVLTIWPFNHLKWPNSTNTKKTRFPWIQQRWQFQIPSACNACIFVCF